jgi:intracellular sulfur oxidation DsrE/DsrF family protein
MYQSMQAPELRVRHSLKGQTHMSVVRTFLSIFGSVTLVIATASPLDDAHGAGAASEPKATVWVYPLIKRYGGVHPRPDLPTGLAPGSEYRVIADVTHGSADRTHALGSLERLARLINLFAYAGVPAAHVHVAALIEGEAYSAMLTNDAYRRRFKVDNPNLDLLRELKSSGVELMVCAQALAENDIPDNDVATDVTVTLSALTDFAGYEARGYTYLQL